MFYYLKLMMINFNTRREDFKEKRRNEGMDKLAKNLCMKELTRH